MGVTIGVNGLSLVHRDSGGVSTATLPDVCLTPPNGAAVPYPNVAVSKDLAAGTSTVHVDGGHPAAIAGSVFARSSGDEPGALGGVASGTAGAEASFLSFSPTVRLEGRPACRLTDKMLHNRGNTIDAAGVVQPPVARAASTRPARELYSLIVEVVDKAGKPVHGPVAVVLKAKGIRRRVTRNETTKRATFRRIPGKKYQVTAIHGCYPEGHAEVTVTRSGQRVKITLERAAGMLRAAAGNKFRIGIKLNPAAGIPIGDAVPEQYHDVVTCTFWSSIQPNGTGDEVSDPRPLADMQAIKQLGLGAEVTPLFWAFRTKNADKWSPNPPWVNTLTTRAVAVQAVKDFITRVLKQFHDHGVLDAVRRVVVINEPMNVLMREETRAEPFIQALLPFERDRRYAKAEVARIARKRKRIQLWNARNPGRRKVAPAVPKPFYKFKSEAIVSFVEIIEHVDDLLSAPGLDRISLIVGDYGVEGWNGTKGVLGMRGYRFYELMQRIIRLLRARNRTRAIARLCVGFQAHLRSGGQLEASSTREPLDFAPASIRKQVKRFKQLGTPVCVTECDLGFPAIDRKPEWKAAEQHRKAVKHHLDAVKDMNPQPPFPVEQFFAVDPATATAKAKARRAKYEQEFAAQRDLMREAVAAMLSAGNVVSFVWWDIADDLDEDGEETDPKGTNFRYHGYLLHRYVVCRHCKDDPAMQVVLARGVAYRKPCYWGTVAAFASPRTATLS